MDKSFFYRFAVRWFVCSLGLWIAAGLIGNSLDFVTAGSQFWVVVIAGLVLAIVNSVIKPLVVLLSLPAILLTLGLFMIVINGFTVWIAGWLYEPLHVGSFWAAMLAGVIIGLVNYLVTAILESQDKS